MIRRCLLFFALVHAVAAAELPPNPADIYGDLFVAVQRDHVFPDQKTFVDCVPRARPADILATYAREKNAGGFDLKRFVLAHFLVPDTHVIALPPGQPIEQHLKALWPLLRRAPDTAVPGSSLLPLPHPYIAPGGRFREIYYWDSYFTLLGLRVSGEESLIAAMVKNFAYLESQYGVIPNGNRTYFLSRSQPPFFSLMLDVLAEKRGASVYVEYLPTLAAEYDYWMDRSAPTHHVVRLDDGTILNRYYDRLATPRPEAFAQEEAVARQSRQPRERLFRNLRAAAESGWDFSSRWLADGQTLGTIETTDILPVDLNALLQHLEVTLAKAYRLRGDKAQAEAFASAASARAAAIRRIFWSPENGYFFDFNLRMHARSSALTLAGVVPLFFQLATSDQAHGAARVLAEKFLQPGGLVTTTVRSGQQWDAPNGWAPLQWLAVHGLENYDEHALAAEIARRWLTLNRQVYARTGKMMEKYDVMNPDARAGGGEYPSQDGFGWTNGVFLQLSVLYPVETAAR